jgi:hydroxyethylthiazole kinase
MTQRAHKSARIHCLTNQVAMAMTAHALTALGFDPSMSSHPADLPALLASADGVLVNLGMLDTQREAAIRSLATGPSPRVLVVDPVMAHRSPFRMELMRVLLPLQPVIKGNASEIEALGPNLSPSSLVVVTGEADEVRWQGSATRIEGGHAMLARISGTGCLAGAVITGFLARAGADEKSRHEAAIASLRLMREASAEAGRHARGPGTFLPAYIDALGNLA